MASHTSTHLPRMHQRNSTILVFILAAIFASNCNGRPMKERSWNIKDLISRPTSLDMDIRGSLFMKTRPKRQATTVKLNVKLFSKSRWFLAVENDGSVEGSSNINSPNVLLRLESVGKSLIRIYGIKAKKYVAMDSSGRLYSTSQPNRDTLFKEYLGSSSYHTFSSASHLSGSNKPMYLALRDNGQPKKGFRTRKTHKSAQFLVMI